MQFLITMQVFLLKGFINGYVLKYACNSFVYMYVLHLTFDSSLELLDLSVLLDLTKHAPFKEK